MSGRRPAAGAAAAGSCRSGGTCSCTNIAVMQLFHELKQQFPTVPDDVVSACIVDHCHDRPACHQRLQQAATATIPRTLPYPQQHPHPRPLIITERRTEADGMTTADLNTHTPIVHEKLEEESCINNKTFEHLPSPSSRGIPPPAVTSPISDRTSLPIPSDRKPPISPCTNKRFASKNNLKATNYEARISKVPVENNPCAGVSVTDLSRNFTQQCELSSATGAIKKTPAKRPASLDLSRGISNCENVTSVAGSPVAGSVNVSVNVNCSVDLVTNSEQTPGNSGQTERRHSTVLQVTPEPVWCQHIPSIGSGISSSDSSPLSYTSVNLTLRTPTSDPQPPIDICSSPASGPSLTYTTSSFDRRQGLQSRLQIIVGPGTGVGTVTAVRTRPRSSYHPDGATVEQTVPPPVRAGSMPDLAHRVNTSATTNHVVLLSRQLERKEQLRNELEAGRERLCAIKKEVQALRLENSPEYRSRLKKEIKHLRSQCESLTREVDRHSESGGGVLLGEVNEDFYRHIYKGQRGSLRPRQQRQHRPPLPNNTIGADNDNEPHWQCHLCTFRNHPLMGKCEQCEMPRVLLGKVTMNENSDDVVLIRQQHATNANPPLALGMNT